MLKKFEELTQRELFKFAAENGLPITRDKQEQLKREYNKARDRGIITDDLTLMRMQLNRIPVLGKEYQVAA